MNFGVKMSFKSELLDEIIKAVSLESGDMFSSGNNLTNGEVSRYRYEIVSDEEEVKYAKPKGVYDIFSIPNVLLLSQKQKLNIVSSIQKSLSDLCATINSKSKILVVGLGNRHISSDSLGTLVCKKICVTLGLKNYPKVMAICPSVLGLTGIETYEIVRGVVDRVKPTQVIFIDSLCASDVSRLGTSVQLSNTGICPGSGVNNKRKCLDKSICKNVVSIGVPLLIYASTFLENSFDKNGIDLDRINSIMQSLEKKHDKAGIIKFFKDLKQVYNDDVMNMVVSHKDIKDMVEILSDIISDAINKSLGVAELKE